VTLGTGVLQCPRCAGELVDRANALLCGTCGTTVPCADGIIDFVQDSARSTLDDIDYDQFYRITEVAARQVIENMAASAGALWPGSLGRVLEIGAGTGGATMGLAALAQFQHLVVTDISSKMLGLCQRNLKAAGLLRPQDMTFVTYGATQKCFQPGSFDTAIGSAVLHHITDVEAFLADLAQTLTATGVAFFIEPSLPFHRAIAGMLADTIAALIRDGVPYDHPGIIRACNWTAETRCNLLHQGDLEFLATREDKHMFDRDEIAAVARRAGFAHSAAMVGGLDPFGEQTIRTYLTQSEVEETMIGRICAELPTHWRRHMALLNPDDRTPSYVLCFSKAASPHQPLPSTLSRTPSPQVAAEPPAIRCYLTARYQENESQPSVMVDGWCFSHADLAWLIVEHDGRTQKFPIWLPRPDVQAIINAAGEMPSLNVLCSGTLGRLAIEPRTAVHIEVRVGTVDGMEVPLGCVTLTRQTPELCIVR
jgi:ubiquinone/menaquinone biosynthesis C-methylase UbiE